MKEFWSPRNGILMMALGVVIGMSVSSVYAGINIADDVICITPCISVGEIERDSIASRKIIDNTIKSRDILDGGLTNKDIASNAIRTQHLKDGTIKSKDILDGGIIGLDISDNAIKTGHIKNGTITSSDLGGLDDLEISGDIISDNDICIGACP